MKSKLIILSIATLLGCVSCNTIGGVGKDVEAVGSDINSAARSTSRAMEKVMWRPWTKAASSARMKRLSGKQCAAARMP